MEDVPAALQATMASTLASLGPVAAPGIVTEVTAHVISADLGMTFLLSLIGNGTGSNTLVATQILGLAFARYVIKVPPLVALSRAELIRLVGPTMQRYVVGKL